MAGFQFMHAEVFAGGAGQARPAKKGGKVVRTNERKLSAAQVVGEAARLAGCAPHVSEPVTPRTLYGLGADELEQWCADLVATAGQQVDEKGRKQRKDTAILMGVVASYPGPPDEGDPNYVRWKALNVAYFCEKFGPNVASIVEHLDEKHGHLHVLVAAGGKSVKPLHPGYAASVPIRQAGGTQAAQSDAYKAAARGWQDEYHKKVAAECGLARLGPGRQRLSRAQWLDQQRQVEAAAIRGRRLDEKDKTISQAAATARELKSKVNLRAAELKEREEALHRRLLALSKVELERVEALARSAPNEAPKPPPKEAPAKQAARAFDYLSGLSAGTGKGSTHRPR